MNYKKVITTVILMIIITIIIFTNNSSKGLVLKKSLTEENIKGDVISITYKYTGQKVFNTTNGSIRTYDPESEDFTEIHVEYNYLGMRVNSKSYNIDGEKDSETSYTYNNLNQIESTTLTNNINNDYYYNEYIYNKKHQPIEKNFYKNNKEFINKTIFKYDRKGNNVYTAFLNENDEIESVEENIYNDVGLVTKSITSFYLNDKLAEYNDMVITIEYGYDNDRNVIETIYTSSDDQSTSRSEKTYDGNRNVIMDIVYDEYAMIYSTDIEYVYDSHNNWIEKKAMSFNKVIQYTTRDIEYR